MGKRRAVINIETLEVFSSMTNAALALNVNKETIFNSINIGHKVKGNRFEYLDVWQEWSDAEKEKYSIKHNIFFAGGKND